MSVQYFNPKLFPYPQVLHLQNQKQKYSPWFVIYIDLKLLKTYQVKLPSQFYAITNQIIYTRHSFYYSHFPNFFGWIWAIESCCQTFILLFIYQKWFYFFFIFLSFFFVLLLVAMIQALILYLSFFKYFMLLIFASTKL